MRSSIARSALSRCTRARLRPDCWRETLKQSLYVNLDERNDFQCLSEARRRLHLSFRQQPASSNYLLSRRNSVLRPLRPDLCSSNVPFTQRRHFVSSWLPEVAQNFSVWGGSGYMLKVLHADGVIPYWACFAIMNIMVRIILFPLVIYGAQTSARFAKVVPEVQFLLSLFRNDIKKAPKNERLRIMMTNIRTLGGIYKLHKINPFSVFLSPLLQLPFFWYVSVDLRKIVNGLDPALAQQLVESPVAWIPDLTEPDPWYGLPILAGLLMYANVEVAVGAKSLSGPTAAKSDTAINLKDLFQSFAVFMPCFTSQLPSGIQIYLVTSFAFTMGQSAALRTESFRKMVVLPSLLAPPPQAKYAEQFIELKQLEQKAREARGSGPVLGKGVLAHGLEVSFAGEYRKSTIQGSGTAGLPNRVLDMENQPPAKTVNDSLVATASAASASGPFIPGISAPPWQLAEQQRQREAEQQQEAAAATSLADDLSNDEREYMPQFSDEVMEKANRGERPIATQFVERSPKSSSPQKLSLKRFKGKKKSSKKRPR